MWPDVSRASILWELYSATEKVFSIDILDCKILRQLVWSILYRGYCNLASPSLDNELIDRLLWSIFVRSDPVRISLAWLVVSVFSQKSTFLYPSSSDWELYMYLSLRNTELPLSYIWKLRICSIFLISIQQIFFSKPLLGDLAEIKKIAYREEFQLCSLRVWNCYPVLCSL